MNLGKTALSVLGTVAPTILTAIGGPFGALAAGILHAALGTNGDDKAVDASLAGASQDTLLKVKQAELDLQSKLADLGVQKEQLVYQDIASARNLEIQSKSWTPSILSYAVLGASTTAFLAVVAGYVKIPTDPGTAVIYGSVLTFLVTESKAILGYWFGSSNTSQAKDETIAQIAKQ